MFRAAGFPGHFHHPFQRVIFRRVGRSAKAIPGGHAIVSCLSLRDALLQKLEGGAKTSPELEGRNRRQLRFGIVHVVNVDTRKIQIAQRLVQLSLEITRRHAMRAGCDVGPTCDAGLDEVVLDILPHVARRRAVEREIAALGADDNFFTRKTTSAQFAERGANRSFASLKAIIRGRVDYVRAQLDRAHDRFGVAPIGFLVGVSEIGADTDR